MTTTSTAAYRLVSISRGAGQCEHCGRNLRKLCTISDGSREMTVGQACCKELTGWTPDAARLRRQEREEAARTQFGATWDAAEALAYPWRGIAKDYMLNGVEEGYLGSDNWITIGQFVASKAGA